MSRTSGQLGAFTSNLRDLVSACQTEVLMSVPTWIE